MVNEFRYGFCKGTENLNHKRNKRAFKLGRSFLIFSFMPYMVNEFCYGYRKDTEIVKP